MSDGIPALMEESPMERDLPGSHELPGPQDSGGSQDLPGSQELTGRAAEVEAVFRAANRRMAGLPVHNPVLQVEMTGLQPWASDSLLGVLVTPWCMNLMLLPRQRRGWDGLLHHGAEIDHRLPCGTVRFVVGRDEESLGIYQMCSLFSPMADFASPLVAREVAALSLAAVLSPPAAAQAGSASMLAREVASRPAADASGLEQPANVSRRTLLRGRRD